MIEWSAILNGRSLLSCCISLPQTEHFISAPSVSSGRLPNHSCPADTLSPRAHYLSQGPPQTRRETHLPRPAREPSSLEGTCYPDSSRRFHSFRQHPE